jgi:hypothetical protein
MRENDIDQAERRATLENDRLVREQQQRGSTFHQHGQSAANDIGGGRFASLGAPHVTGSTPIPKYPAASTPFQSDPVGVEPPLGYAVSSLNPFDDPEAGSLPCPAQGTGGADGAPSAPPDVEHAAPPSSSEQTNE